MTAGGYGIRTGLFSKMRENWPDGGYDSVGRWKSHKIKWK